MATKSWNKSRIMKNQLLRTSSGAVLSEANSILYSVSECTAVFSRPKPIPPRPLGCTPLIIYKRWDNPGVFTEVRGSLTYRGAANYAHGTGTSVLVSSETASMTARAKAQAKFTGDNMDLGETLGGLKQTSLMVAKRARTLAAVASLLRKGVDPASAIKGLPSASHLLGKSKSFANLFLEYSFGWLPLVQDVYNTLELRHNKLVEGQEIRRVSGNKVKKFEPWGDPSGSDFAIRGGVGGVVRNAHAANLNALGLANPALLAWQLLPYSFVVDYFFNVSRILASWTYGVGLEHTYGFRIYETRSTRFTQRKNVVYRLDRTITRAADPIGLLSFNATSLKAEGLKNANRVAVAAALLRQRL